MHLRRALVLFGVVLVLAALAASISQPRDDPGRNSPRPAPDPETAPRASPGPSAAPPARLRFRAGGKRVARRLRAGQAAVVTVDAPEPGQVELRGLGLVAPADPLTPARFDVLVAAPGQHEVRFTPAQGGESALVGILRVER